MKNDGQGNHSISYVSVTLTVIEGDNLVAKDKHWITRRKNSSDPYVKVRYKDEFIGQTEVKKKTLSPIWGETFEIKINNTYDAVQVLKGKSDSMKLYLDIFDKDLLSKDDYMGQSIIVLPLERSFSEPHTSWYDVGPGTDTLTCRNPSGRIKVTLDMLVKKPQNMVRGNTYSLPCSHIEVDLQWGIEGRLGTDLDTSCVAIDEDGNILMGETVYFGDLVNSNKSIRHSGDDRVGGIGEKIDCDLDSVSDKVFALYFIVTVATPDRTLTDFKTASVTVMDKTSSTSLCQFNPSLGEKNTAMFLMRVNRELSERKWAMTIIEDMHGTGRDFGTLIPEIKGYSRDLIPGIVVNPMERVAVMRKGRSIQLKDYGLGVSEDQALVFALAWDITDGQNIDLDASAICLDSSHNLVEIVSKNQLSSSDNSIIHHGDEQEGDKEGDDEEIELQLQSIQSRVEYVGFVINSYSGEQLSAVSKAKCHLYNQVCKEDIAQYQISNDNSLDKYTGLLMAYLYRDSNEWNLRVIGKAVDGRVASDVVEDLQDFLRTEPPPRPAIVPETGIIANAMPDRIPLSENKRLTMNPFIIGTS